MAAVVRLKRHLDEEPLSALILNCKKRKTDDATDENGLSTVLTFAGTVNNQEDDISPHICKLSKDDLENSFKKHVPNITSKARQQTKDASDENRYKVVNLHRSVDKETKQDVDSTAQKSITVLDVVTTGSTNENEETNFVYDLYYTDSEGINNGELDTDQFQICPANEIFFDDCTAPDSDNDSDDSNDENNWRNDYPEDEEDSINEDDMIQAMERLSVDSDDYDCTSVDDRPDASVDERPDGFMYSIDSEAVGFEEDVDFADGRRYGELYARFKMRQKRVEDLYNKDLYHDEVDDTDDDYYD